MDPPGRRDCRGRTIPPRTPTAFPSRRSPAIAALFEQSVYDGPYTKAAALVHTLGRCRWLERSHMAVAAASGVMYPEAAGVHVKSAREDAVALKDLLLDPAYTAGKVAALLRTWPTAT